MRTYIFPIKNHWARPGLKLTSFGLKFEVGTYLPLGQHVCFVCPMSNVLLKYLLKIPILFLDISFQGILAVDMSNSSASANVTQGGIGYNFVNIRMKSERGRGLKYDIYIYA